MVVRRLDAPHARGAVGDPDQAYAPGRGAFQHPVQKARPRGQMTLVNLEDESEEPEFGVSKIQQFTWKQNLDLYACIECGRCQDFCPTYNSEKPLKPKHLIHDLKHHLLSDGSDRSDQSDRSDLSGQVPVRTVFDWGSRFGRCDLGMHDLRRLC